MNLKFTFLSAVLISASAVAFIVSTEPKKNKIKKQHVVAGAAMENGAQGRKKD